MSPSSNTCNDNATPDLLEFTSEDLEQFCIQKLGARPGRGRSVAAWLFRRGVTDLDAMDDINKTLRDGLKRSTRISTLEICDRQVAGDGTQKLLYRLEDDCTVEGVLIPGKRGRRTLCISTQVGCAIGCAFCFTATGGFTRNLRAAEMVGQILAARQLSDIPISNVVLMGQGEPLNNYEAVRRFIDVATDPNGLAFSPRKLTVSTSGLMPLMERLGEETRVSLALSLNATTDEVRDSLIPINRVYPIGDLMNCLKRFCGRGKRRVLIEYVLLKGVNDSLDDARRLLDLVQGLPCMVNLLPFNAFAGGGFERPDAETVNAFWKVLQGAGITTIVRDSRGDEISAACGQLKGEKRAGQGTGKK
ncbi:MAG: 23S rRNA (adenine(2503)-C(2))-methyltransferase RlmN [Nitrospirota bacterium]|nr:23S rRNA (adenine(2503)-C(2))-methyltransferase RlmN [Nitrospirota bacterium]